PLIWNVLSIAAIISFVSVVPLVFMIKPRIIKTRRVMIQVGVVVRVIYRIWVNRSLPVMAGAKFVVSLRGDILSPKYAPDKMAPAVIPNGMPNVRPIPIRAIPTVAEVVQELPVARLTTEQIITQVTKNMVGFKTCSP